jgi:hypothetical protein
MFDELPLPYLAYLHFLKISRTILLPLTHLNYRFSLPSFWKEYICIYITASVLSPGGGGYYAYT